MCGIAGVATANGADPDRLAHLVHRMNGVQVHRGPDDDGIHVDPRVGLGSRRLSIIDVSGGHMPVANETRDVWVVQNGEIYNFMALREELQARGHTFRTRTDTEVLVHLYEEHGADMVKRLIGMFAFALWDARDRSLLLARDRLGIKPLYVQRQPDRLLFGSELKSLLTVAEEALEPDLDALIQYLALGYVKEPATIFEGIEKLPPGSVLRYRDGRAESWQYWEYPAVRPDPEIGPEEAVDEVEALVRTVVRDRLIADVPLGAFLSGGVDSSVVVAMASEAKAGRLETFSVGFEGADELPYARRVAEVLGTDHHEIVLGADDCKDIGWLVDAFDEPFGDSSAIPTSHVSQLARSRVTVALSGDGGDELFGGYDQYVHDARWAWVDRVPGSIRRLVFGLPARLLPAQAFGRNLLRSLGGSREERFTLFRTEELSPSWDGLLHPGLADRLNDTRWFAREFDEGSHLPFPQRLLYVDGRTYLADDILTKVDRMSMVHSLETRVPLLDHRLVELAATLPSHVKFRNGQTKWVLRQVAERFVPRDVFDRPKHGFSLPIAEWLRGDLSSLLHPLLSEDAHSMAFLHRPAVERLVNEHRRQRRDHSYVLWRLIMLEAWLRRDGPTPAPGTPTGTSAAGVER